VKQNKYMFWQLEGDVMDNIESITYTDSNKTTWVDACSKPENNYSKSKPCKCATKTIDDFKGTMQPWLDIGAWEQYIKSIGVEIIEGGRHNRTDGEVHYILKRGKDSHELHTNYWDYRLDGWNESFEWLEGLEDA